MLDRMEAMHLEAAEKIARRDELVRDGLTGANASHRRRIVEAMNRDINRIVDARQRLHQLVHNSPVTHGRSVTDKALVRYAELVLGWDVEAARAEVFPHELSAVVKRLGDGRYPLEGAAGAFVAVVVDGVVVTIEEG